MLAKQISAIVVSSVLVGLNGLADTELCLPTCTGTGESRVCVFKATIDIYASETGYFHFEGCEGTQPTLGLYAGVKHIFDQSNHTNWFHPLGFAYGPDGVYANNLELEKVQEPPNGQICNVSTPCQHPQYQLNGENLCSLDENGQCPQEDFGLDEYEGVYFHGDRGTWIDAGNFSVSLTITDPATTEIFYFCHIHNFMSGRIKILNEDGTQRDATDRVVIPYEYHTVDGFDATCGTYNLSSYENGAGCPDMTFLCTDNPTQFGKCMVAMDCAMHVGMRVSGNLDPTVTFMHQMIAHHQNAVNMAKALLKAGPPSLKCGTSYDGRRLQEEDDEEHDFCHDLSDDGATPAIDLLWDIINTQNAQITFMRSWLNDNEQPAYDYCEHKSTFTAALIGISVGAIVLIILAVGGTYFYMRGKVSTAKNAAVQQQGEKPDSVSQI